MRIPDCPKNMRDCPKENCPSYPCWAYEKYLDSKDDEKKQKDNGWK